jgi:hypothetical protein
MNVSKIHVMKINWCGPWRHNEFKPFQSGVMFVLVKRTKNCGKRYVVYHCCNALTRLFHLVLVMYFTTILISKEQNIILDQITGSNSHSEGYSLHCESINRLSWMKCFVVQAHNRPRALTAFLIFPICLPYLQNGPRQSFREGLNSIPAVAYNSDWQCS